MHRRSSIGRRIGLGLVAGFAGTAAITAVQLLRIRFGQGEPSDAPVKAVKKTVGLQPINPQVSKRVNYAVHWSYGTTWGLARLAMARAGLRGLPATALHLGAVWGAALVMLPSLKIAPPVREWGKKALMMDLVQHAAYAMAAGATFDALAARFDRRLG